MPVRSASWEGRADCVVTDDYDAIPYLCGLAEGKGKMLFGINRPNILKSMWPRCWSSLRCREVSSWTCVF